MLQNIRIVLVEPQHPGNVGAAARAMKNMGLSQLYLVAPKSYPNAIATVRAAGADDILANARVVPNIKEALIGCDWVYGTSARERALEKTIVSPRHSAEQICSRAAKAAILFGRERVGLTNEELSICHFHIVIPASENFSSLNLAAAVQVIAYELRMASLDVAQQQQSVPERELASMDQVLGFYQHLQQTLLAIGFLDPKKPRLLMQRLTRMFNRALLDEREINILRGILSKMDKYTQ